MLLDATELDHDSSIDCDVCIVGAGPAGLTIANELSHLNLRICLLESGGFRARDTTKAQILGQQFGVPIDVIKQQRRRLGGGSNFWGGVIGRWFCACPLDPLDFEERSWIPDSGWPVSYNELLPYYNKASEILNILPMKTFDIGTHNGFINSSFQNNHISTTIIQKTRPVRFKQKYLTRLNQHPNVRVICRATTVKLNEAENRPDIKNAEIITPQRTRHKVTAAYFILACGGIETPKLLLASKDKSSSGIGNEHDLVGRYFMQHPKGRHGLVKLKRRTRVFPFYTRLFGTRKVGVTAGIKFSERLQEQHGLLNHRLVFHPIYSLNEGYASDLYRALRRVQSHTNGAKGTFAETLSRLQACPGLTRSELLEALGALTWPASYTVINHMEQMPDRESRVFLSREKDEFGQWRLDTNWRIGALEKESLCQLHELTREAIEGQGIGWFQSNLLADADDWPILQDSAHYLGATRMHRDPKKGVTNENCRVHGVRNLYAVGSSVFPTGGYANPTVTILALSVRLAGHLKAFDLTRRW